MNRDARATAGAAIVDLTFLELANGVPRTEGLTLGARWAQNQQPAKRDIFDSLADLRRRDLLPNGEPNLIDVALKYRDDDAMYAFNDESVHGSGDWREPKYRLAADAYLVNVRINGVNMVEPFEFDLLLRNLGKGNSLEVTRWQSTPDTAASQPQPTS